MAARLASLDSIRGIAVLMVVAAHLTATLGSELAHNIYAVGVHGVDVFFALSGFLIAGILLENQASPRVIRTFYARRAFRILPVYLLLLASFMATRAIDAHFQFGLGAYFYLPPGMAWSYALLLQNNVMAYFNVMLPTWLIVTWSLAAEEQFYLASPWIAKIFRPKSIALLCLLAMGLCPVLRYAFVVNGSWLPAAILLVCKADAICVGVLVAVAYRTNALNRIGRTRLGLLAAVFGVLAVVVTCRTGSILAYDHSSLVWILVWQPTLWALSSMLLVAWLVTLPANREIGLFSYAGKTSYFVYLFHLPAILVGTMLAGRYHVNYWVACGGCLALTWIAAEVSWRRMEKPGQEYARARFRY